MFIYTFSLSDFELLDGKYKEAQIYQSDEKITVCFDDSAVCEVDTVTEGARKLSELCADVPGDLSQGWRKTELKGVRG